MSKSKNRPIGITILSVLGFISAAITLLLGLIIMLIGSAAIGTALAALGALGAIAGSVLIIYGILQAIYSYGLWNMKKWAWMLAMISYGLTIAYTIYTGVETAIVTIVINMLVMVYLYTARKKFR